MNIVNGDDPNQDSNTKSAFVILHNTIVLGFRCL